MMSHSSNTSDVTAMPDESMHIFFEFVLHGVVLNLIGMIGLCGNLVCIIILRRPKMRRNSTNVILATLATFDFLLIITSILMLGLPAIYRYTKDSFFAHYYYGVFPYVTPWIYAFGLIAQTGSIYCTLGVTVERYIVICWPLRSSTICTYGRVKIGVACTILFSILYNIPRFFEVSWIIDSNPDPDWLGEVNVTATGSRPQIVMTDLRQEPIYISVYITWMYLVFMYVLPFGGLSVLNLLMFLDVRRSNARQSTLSPHEKKELRLAVMLMVVVVVFLTCNILPLIVNILEVLNIELKPLTETSNLLVTFNSSVNVFIYIIFGEKFQRQLLQWVKSFWCCKKMATHISANGMLGGGGPGGGGLSATPIHNNNLTTMRGGGPTFQAPFSATITSNESSTWFAKCRRLTSLKRLRWNETNVNDETATTIVLRDISRSWPNGKTRGSSHDLYLNGSPPDQIRNPSPNDSIASTSFNQNFYKSSQHQKQQQQQQQQQQQCDQDSLEEGRSNRTEEQVILRTNLDESDQNESTPFL